MVTSNPSSTNVLYETDTAFLNVVLGGVGLRAGAYHHQRYLADNRPYSQVTVQIDTDPNTASYVDYHCPITLDAGKLNALMADPDKFGPATGIILKEYARFLNPEDIENGSRTVRCLTQLAFDYHAPDITRTLRDAVHTLVREQRTRRILPFFISSSGGGAGSALQVLLIRKFMEPEFRLQLTEGLHDAILNRPICFVAEPYALAQRNNSQHHSKILGNAFAFRLESEVLERTGGTKYVFHLAFSNRYGTILDDPRQISRVLGTAVHEFQRNWPELKARFVDGPDVAALGDGYSGIDLPENWLRRGGEQWAAFNENESDGANGENERGGDS